MNVVTPEQINRAIAEHCGWKKVYNGPEPDDRWMTPDGLYYRTTKDLPNYHGDLNAMHEAEKALNDFTWETYWYALARITPGRPACVCHATAAQRAEAFLRTINKWKDE